MSLKLNRYHLLGLFLAANAGVANAGVANAGVANAGVANAGAAGPLPAHDPSPSQAEPSPSEVASRRETAAPPVAIPRESASYFAVTGFSDPSLSGASGKGDANLAFCHTDQWSAACLVGLIIYRCGQYTFPLTPFGCSLAATSFVDLLQMKRIPVVVDGKSYRLPVIFTGLLEKLVQDHATQLDLQSLRILLTEAAKSRRSFDLWQWYWAATHGDFDRTLENLAVLFQDTSAVAIQVNYLRGVSKARGFDTATTRAIDDLDEIVYQLNSEILADEDWRSWLQLYPTKEIQADTTPLIYHFYPMAFTARLLKRLANGNRLSGFIPFLFNTEYLNQTLDPAAWPLHHPKPFKIDNDELRWKMRDFYNGYLGARWGLQKTASLPGLEKFETGYAKAPYATMRHHFWSMPNP
jgi:hypothetical protein